MSDPSAPTNDASLRTGWAREVRSRLSSLHLSATREAEIVDELSQHLDDRYRELIAGGASSDEATRLTLADFRSGNVLAQRMASLRQAHSPPPITPGAPTGHVLTDLWQDLRYAARTLRKAPGFATTAVLTLALGVGANTAIFGVVYQTLLQPLPYNDPDGLVAISTRVPQLAARFPMLPVDANDFLEYRRSSSAFVSLSALSGGDFNLTGDGEPERLHGARVSSSFFSMLGVGPILGRDFVLEEDQEGRDDVILISHGLWQRRFAADPALVNRTVSLDGRPHTVIGIMPADLLFPTGRQLDPLIAFGPRVEVWKPAAFTRDELKMEGAFNWAVVGRLKPGITAKVAQQDLDRVAQTNVQRLRRQEPSVAFEMFSTVTPLHNVFTGEIRQSLLALEGAVGILLLIACVNVANLLLVRMSHRERELATRAALGAARWRLVRQVLTESLVVTTLGGIAGLALAAWAGRLLIAYGPRTAATRAWTLDGPVVVFAGVAALATGLCFGLVAALHTTRPAVLGRLKDAARAVSDRHAGGLRRTLVAVQVALSTALLAVAALMLHSFVNVMRVDAGFAVERVLAVDLSLPSRQYTSPQTVIFYRDLVERIASRSGVIAAGAISHLPIAHEGNISMVLLDSDTQVRLDRPSALRRSVTAGLFTAMDIPLLVGRVFAEQEPRPAAILSESLAHTLWPGVPLSSVVGRGVRRDPADPITTVIGVVGDIRADALDRAAPSVFYHHYSQDVRRGMTVIVRTAENPRALASLVRAEVSQLDHNLPIAAIRTMGEIVSTSVAPRRFQMALVALMATLALVLAVVGIYGVTSYSVARRTQEIGLRVALGAQRRDVLRAVLAEGLKPVVAGALAGVAGGLGAATAMRSVLFGIGPLDPFALAGVTGLLVAAATLACYLPARAAAALDPVAALKID